MAILAELVDLVIGVDTHKHTHTAAVVRATTGAMVDQTTVPSTPAGYQQLLRLANRQEGRRVWAIEGTGGYGAGLTRFLQAHAEQVVELDRPKRAARRHGAKSDPLDATRAAREALARDQLAQPRAAGHRAARRYGWPPAAPRSRLPPTPNGSSMRWSSLPPSSFAAGYVA
jgi:transposase